MSKSQQYLWLRPSARESNVVAICGIDGSGKSTILDRLREEIARDDILFLQSTAHPNVDSVHRLHESAPPADEQYAAGSFARCNAFAWALDFLLFYREHILPNLDSGKLLICDRYKPCYLAYAMAVGGIYNDVSRLLSKVVDARRVIYLDVPLDIAASRLAKRGWGRGENRIALEAFKAAYEKLLKDKDNVTFIDNGGELGPALRKLLPEIRDEHPFTHFGRPAGP